MSIFPSTPEVNDTFTSNGTTWKWDGSSWNFFSSPAFIGVGGDATVAFQIDQPDVSELEAGALWIDSDEDISNGLLVATFTRWVSLLSSSALVLEGLDDNDLALLYTPGFEKVYVNGILLVRGEDYTAEDGTTIQLTVAAEEGDVVEIDVFESFAIADTYTKAQSDAKFFAVNSSRVDRWTKTYSASATVITGSDDNAFALDYLVGLESVFVNGVLLAPEEYTRTSASVITLDEAVLAGDVVDIISPKAFEVANTYTIEQIDSRYNNYSRWTKTFSASATVLTGLDDSSNTLSYRAGYEKIYLNGILLIKDIDYTTTDENTITLNEAVVINDTINIISFEPFNIADTYTQEESDNKFLNKSIVDAKGDLLVGTADNVLSRIGVGINDQALLADSSTPTGLIWGNVGKILQIVRAIDLTQRSTTSTSFVDCGTLTVTITPKKSNSTILLLALINGQMNSGGTGDQRGSFSITDSSNNRLSGAGNISLGLSFGSSVTAAAFPVTLVGYSTPATTSAITYKVRFAVNSSTHTLFALNIDADSPAQLYAIEVAA